MLVHWTIVNALVSTARIALMAVAFAKSGEGLRCFCGSFVNGAPLAPPPVECDRNKTCYIPNSKGSFNGMCYTKLVLQSDTDAEHITHSCAYVARYNLTLASTPCINLSSPGLGRVMEMVCCSTDYCNIDVRQQGRPHHQFTSSLGESSSLNQGQEQQWLTWKVGTVIFSCCIVIVILAGLVLFVSVTVLVQCRRKHMQTLPTHLN